MTAMPNLDRLLEVFVANATIDVTVQSDYVAHCGHDGCELPHETRTLTKTYHVDRTAANFTAVAERLLRFAAEQPTASV